MGDGRRPEAQSYLDAVAFARGAPAEQSEALWRSLGVAVCEAGRPPPKAFNRPISPIFSL